MSGRGKTTRVGRKDWLNRVVVQAAKADTARKEAWETHRALEALLLEGLPKPEFPHVVMYWEKAEVQTAFGRAQKFGGEAASDAQKLVGDGAAMEAALGVLVHILQAEPEVED